MLVPDYKSQYSVVAGIPLVGIDVDTPISLGGTLFWQGSDFQNFISDAQQQTFPSYLKWASEFVCPDVDTNKSVVSSRREPTETTFLSIRNEHILRLGRNEDRINDYIYDAIFIFYFTVHFHELPAPNNLLNPFLFVRRTTEEVIGKRELWTKPTHEHEADFPARIIRYPAELMEAGGRLLDTKYFSQAPARARRLIRAIRYYSGRFYEKYRAPIRRIGQDPEDAVFLASAFEAALDLRPSHSDETITDRLKGLGEALKLRSKYQLSVFQKWAEEFYNHRSRLVHGDDTPDTSWNESFDLSPVGFGFRVFPVVLYLEMAGMGFVNPLEYEPWLNERFDMYLWTENGLLLEIKETLEHLKVWYESKDLDDEGYQRLSALERYLDAYVAMIEEHIEGIGVSTILYRKPAPEKQKVISKLKGTVKGLFQNTQVTSSGRREALKDAFCNQSSLTPQSYSNFIGLL